MRLLIIDNYDSFTYNIVHIVRALGLNPDVVRNDRITLPEIEKYDKIIISPGPGIPSEAGLLPSILKEYSGKKPILGVCLGHQAIAEHFGAKLENLKEVFHGVQTQAVKTADDYILDSFPAVFRIGRYHSWIVSNDGLPDELVVTSRDNEGNIMSYRHRDLDIHGVQFHPESLLTPDGEKIIEAFLSH